MGVTSLPFDPILFLGINKEKLAEEEILKLRESLAKYIARYLYIKLIKQIPQEKMTQLERFNDPMLVLGELSNSIPNFETVMTQELENFKKDFKEN